MNDAEEYGKLVYEIVEEALYTQIPDQDIETISAAAEKTAVLCFAESQPGETLLEWHHRKGDKEKVLRLLDYIRVRVEKNAFLNALSLQAELQTELLKCYDDILRGGTKP